MKAVVSAETSGDSPFSTNHYLLLAAGALLAPAPAHALLDYTVDWTETGTVGDGWGDVSIDETTGVTGFDLLDFTGHSSGLKLPSSTRIASDDTVSVVDFSGETADQFDFALEDTAQAAVLKAGLVSLVRWSKKLEELESNGVDPYPRRFEVERRMLTKIYQLACDHDMCSAKIVVQSRQISGEFNCSLE